MSQDETAVAPTTSQPGARMSRRQGWLLLAGLLLLSALLFWLDYDPPAALVRTAVSAPGFAPMTIMENVTLTAPPAVWGDTAVFIGALDEMARSELLAVDAASGVETWRRSAATQSRPKIWPGEWVWGWPFQWRWGQVAAHDDRLYFSDAFALTTAVTALDAQTGAPIWQRQIGLLNGSDLDLFAVNEQQLVAQLAVEYYNTFYALDPVNGRSIRHQQSDAANLFWYDATPQRFYERFADGIAVRGERPWQQRFDHCGLTPIVTTAVIVAQVQRCDETAVSHLLAFDRADGALLWRLDVPLVSNVAVDEETAVALTADAQLLLLDVRSGALRAVLPFDAPTSPPDDEVAYFVGLQGETAVVYFGDSRQLFFYRLAN